MPIGDPFPWGWWAPGMMHFVEPRPMPHQGCICPPTSEQTCQSPMCPRKNPFHQQPTPTGTAAKP